MNAAVSTRTTLLLVRHRFQIVTTRDGEDRPMLAEDCAVLAFTGAPNSPVWLGGDQVDALLAAVPTDNVHPAQASDFLRPVVAHAPSWLPHLDDDAQTRADELHAAHLRVRDAANQRGVRYKVTPQRPVDVLGIYIYLPAAAR